MYELEFKIEGLPSLANIASGKSHWRHAHREAKRWHEEVVIAMRLSNCIKPKKPLKHYLLYLVRYSAVEPDYDGLVRGFKYVVDGLKYSKVIEDDKLSNSGQWICLWERVPRKQGHLRIRVQERN